MNTSVESLTHKMQRAAVGKMVDVVLSHADKDRQKTVGQLVDVAKQFYGSSFSAEAYEHARQTLTDPALSSQRLWQKPPFRSRPDTFSSSASRRWRPGSDQRGSKGRAAEPWEAPADRRKPPRRKRESWRREAPQA